MIGHSQGGWAALTNAKTIRHPVYGGIARTLKSLILFAPYIADIDPETFIPGIDVSIDSFLGIHPVNDSDPTTFGLKDSGKIMRSAFMVYDLIGETYTTQPFVSNIEKDFIFADIKIPSDQNGAKFAHYFQNSLITKTYTTAFLHKHLKGNVHYDDILKLQAKPPSLANSTDTKTIRQQHDERIVLRPIADFDHEAGNLEMVSTTPGISASIIDPWKFDSLFPHASKCLQIIKNGGGGSFTIVLDSTVAASQVTHLTFRAGQKYSMSGKDLDMRIIINQKTVLLSQSSGEIELPSKAQLGNANATKNAMRTHVIPISAFMGVGEISAIEFVFSATDMGSAVLYFDSFAFWIIN